MGATTEMPFRALTYVDAAIRIAKILPCAQLQIVHVNNLGAKINNVDSRKSYSQSLRLAALSREHLLNIAPELEEKYLHAQDTDIDLEPFIHLSTQVFQERPELAQKLRSKGSKHGGDACEYAAAHCAFQDTDQLKLDPLLMLSPRQVKADRIVSIGCQQERTFYLARMAMRQAASDISLLSTAQIFTHHVSPPYFQARGGEQTLDDAILHDVDLSRTDDSAALRDINHFMKVNKGEIHG